MRHASAAKSAHRKHKRHPLTALGTLCGRMESSAVALTKLTVADCFAQLTDDDSLMYIAETLEDGALLTLMTASNALRHRLLVDDLWLNKISALAVLYPGIAHLERGEEERAFAWYMRWCRALASSERMARAHAKGEMPYMKMYGTFVDGQFVPSTPLRLPAPQGLVAELITYAVRLGKADRRQDAALMFENAPPNMDSSFGRIVEKSDEAVKRGVAAPAHLRRLVVFLETVYQPTTLVPASPLTSSTHSEVCELSMALAAEQAHSEVRERVLSNVRRRLKHTKEELKRAHERIAELEVENATLRLRVAELESENRDLKRQVAQLTGSKHALERELEDWRTDEQKLKVARAKLKEERTRAKVAEAKLRPMHLERARLIKQLKAAEARYEEAETDLEGLQSEAELVGQCARLQEVVLQRDCAAQVAAAHHDALARIEHALDTELATRDYFTPEQFVERAIVQAEAGVVSPQVERLTAHVMASKATAGEEVTLAPTSASGRGRGRTYLAIVKHIVPSDQVTPRELQRRSKELGGHVTQTSAGAEATQLNHFAKTNKQLMTEALDNTTFSKPKSPSLHDLVALKNETTGVMYKNIVGFVKDKCGVKFDQGLSEAHVRAAFDDFKFEYDLFHFSEVETKEKETEVTEGGVRKKIIKEIKKTVRGDVLVVKDPVDVIRRSARVHAEAGHVAYPANVPGDVWPISIMIDAGAGITKVALKHVCLKRADSVRAITLLGVLIGAKDTYSAMRKAFGPLYQAISLIMRENQYVSLPWAPRLPTTAKYELNASGPDGRKVLEMVSCDPDEYLM